MGLSMKKSLYKKLLENLSTDPFTVTFWDGTVKQYNQGVPVFHIAFHRPLSTKQLTENPMLALAEGYMDKSIEVDGDLEYIIESIFNQQGSILDQPLALRALNKFKSTGRKQSKDNVAHHYDLGNDFYKLWLDETMNYSCAYFESPDDSLYQAQKNKTYHILKKLNLQPG